MTFQEYFRNTFNAIPFESAKAVLTLSEDGGTVPFIARYRKEKTGNLDEVQIRQILEANQSYNEAVHRQDFLIKEINGQGNLTDELKKRIQHCFDINELEEIYRPFKRKKKTKATLAREAGLMDFADWVWAIGHGEIQDSLTLEVKAKNYINVKSGIVTYDLVLKGAQDILVEKIANNTDLRAQVRENYLRHGRLESQKAKGFKEHSKYDMYIKFEETISSLCSSKKSYRYLAMRRGWQEDELSLTIKGDDEQLTRTFVMFACSKLESQAADFLAKCAKLAFTSSVIPSITNEIHRYLKQKADEQAIAVFADNVKKVLLSSPFGARCVLGVDPGLKTGCKIALLDKGGNFISNTVLHILGEDSETKAIALFREVVKQIKIEAIAIGNGTGGREAEAFLRKVFKTLELDTPIIMVNESGASVYSASDVAREEFPDLDITVRGAISIARRLQDPLAELVKIEPKSIGVGQYQHDVSQTQLKKCLNDVVESCVNLVGVDVNTASKALLQYVSGIGPAFANNIVEYRSKHGLFQERSELLNISQLSSKAFEQAAGFLRIPGAKIILDTTGIHPERYTSVYDMASDVGCKVSDLLGDGVKKLLPHKEKWAALIGEYTFEDVLKELANPGRDHRDPFKILKFREDIHEIKDLQVGFICPGIVTNVTNFGAFVDVGVHQDGLVHISEISYDFIDDPSTIVSPGDHVTVRVLGVDIEKNQISFSMKITENPKTHVAKAKTKCKEKDDKDIKYNKNKSTNIVNIKEISLNDSDKSSESSESSESSKNTKVIAPVVRPIPVAEGQVGDRKEAKIIAPNSRSQQSKHQHQQHHNQNKVQIKGNKAGGGDQSHRRPKQVFNNPFAALSNLNVDSKKES